MCDSERAGVRGAGKIWWGLRSRNSIGIGSGVEARALAQREKKFRRWGGRVRRKVG